MDRKHPRHPVEMMVFFRSMGSEDWKQGTATNLSKGGLCIATLERLPAKSVIELQFVVTPHGQTKTHLKIGVVAWSNSSQYGIEFL